MARILTLAIAITGLCIFSISAQAGINPFKKTKDLVFGNDVVWQLKSEAAVKSGQAKEGDDTLYYHLNVSKDRLHLRLGKNDPSGEVPNTRDLDKLAIIDVLLDGRRFIQFQRCLDNQGQVNKVLKQGALVANDTCVNAGGGGDFSIRLDEASKNELKATSQIEFIIEPYGRPVKLSYSMSGFAGIMSKLDKPKPVAVAVVKAIPVVKAKPVVKPPVVVMCQANPPVDFKSAVRALSYPCDQAAKKEKAEQAIAAQVEKEKQKMEAEMKRLQQEEDALAKASKSNQREIDWARQQTEVWVKRCEKHWSQGVSPCYCVKYLDQAPAGVKNTCGR